MSSSTSVTRMSDDEEWGDSAADPDADWGDADADADAEADADVDAESGWGDDDIKDAADTSGWDDTQPSASSSLPPLDDAELPSLSRQASYRILDNDSLLATQNKLIAQNAEVLFVTPTEAGLLLRHYGWKSRKLQSEWFENQKKVRETVGITAVEEGKREATRTASLLPAGRVQCQSAYCDEVDVKDAYALNCGHWFCGDDWSAYLVSQINDGQRSIFTKCMGMKCTLDHAHKFGCSCSELVPESVFTRFVTDKRLLDKYRRWLLDSFVEGQKSIKWSRRTASHQHTALHMLGWTMDSLRFALFDYSFSSFFRSSQVSAPGLHVLRVVSIGWHESYSVSLWLQLLFLVYGRGPHSRAVRSGQEMVSPAVQAQVHIACRTQPWGCVQRLIANTLSAVHISVVRLLREKSDDATAIWLAAKTKECPKCQVRIEKNKACNHMTCVKCGHNCQPTATTSRSPDTCRDPRLLSERVVLTGIALVCCPCVQSAGCARVRGRRTATRQAGIMYAPHTMPR